MKEFYYEKMIEAQKEAFAKFKSFSTDERKVYRFAHMLLQAEAEEIDGASYLLQEFDINNLDRWAILEDIDLFSEEYDQIKELDYMTTITDF